MAGREVAITVEIHLLHEQGDGDDQGDEVAGHVAGVGGRQIADGTKRA